MLNNREKITFTEVTTPDQFLIKEVNALLQIDANPERLLKSLQHLMFVYLRSSDATVSRKDNQAIADDLFYLTSMVETIEKYEAINKINQN